MKQSHFRHLFIILIIGTFIILAGCGDSNVEKAGNDNGNNNDEAETTNDGNNQDEPGNEPENNQEETPENEPENDDGSENDENDTENLSVGDSVNFNDIQITLNEVRIEPGGDFDDPDNDKFIVANLTAENNSDEEANISSMLNVELYDEEGYSYSTTILTEGVQAQFDGSVPAGKKLRGEIPFDVPDSGTYELHYSDPFKSGKAIWIIDSDELE